MMVAVALEPKISSPVVATVLSDIGLAPSREGILLLSPFPNEKGGGGAVEAFFLIGRRVEGLIRVRSRFDAAAISPLLTDIARDLWSSSNAALAVQLVSAFRLTAFENDLVLALRKTDLSATNQVSALRALREIGAAQDEILA